MYITIKGKQSVRLVVMAKRVICECINRGINRADYIAFNLLIIQMTPLICNTMSYKGYNFYFSIAKKPDMCLAKSDLII